MAESAEKGVGLTKTGFYKMMSGETGPAVAHGDTIDTVTKLIKFRKALTENPESVFAEVGEEELRYMEAGAKALKSNPRLAEKLGGNGMQQVQMAALYLRDLQAEEETKAMFKPFVPKSKEAE